ncbi:MAG: hydrogenase nickel incorporation protein HypB [Candidatus Omnitrophica bacterium]|nr:hydrogenase nickel incorporation protein HypB [Candidatus Omnitrophota bacterium]
MKVTVAKRILKDNDVVAEKNREIFKRVGLLAVNFISSPGSGKTTLLEKTILALLPDQKATVVVGDLQTTRDADRLAPNALDVVQINTGLSCHLYANQVTESLSGLNIEGADYLFIENVGNMVCPGEFDLGENAKVILLSIPEGDDKVAKYPTIFRAADLVLLTKVDLLGVLDFDIKRIESDIKKLNSNLEILHVSPLKGQGMNEWISWLKAKRQQSVGARAKFVTEA